MRRQYKRIPVEGDEIRLEIMTEIRARVSDLGMLGMGVKLPKRLRPGSTCTVRIGSNGSFVFLQGTLVWEQFSGLEVNPHGEVDSLFSAGIRLIDAPGDFMKRAGGEDSGSLRAIRVKTSDLTVLLSYPESLTILTISYGGLLAESWNPMVLDTENIARLFMPDSTEPVKCVVRVTTCKPVKHGTEKKYHVGFQFVAMDDARAELIRAFVRKRSSF